MAAAAFATMELVGPRLPQDDVHEAALAAEAIARQSEERLLQFQVVVFFRLARMLAEKTHI